MLDPDQTGVTTVTPTETLQTKLKLWVFTREKTLTIERMKTRMESISCSSNSPETNIRPVKIKNSIKEEEVSVKSKIWLDNWLQVP